MITYERVILQTLNFNIRPPWILIMKHVTSILNMIDRSLEDILDPESFKQYKLNFQKYLKERKKERIIKRRGARKNKMSKGGSTAFPSGLK